MLRGLTLSLTLSLSLTLFFTLNLTLIVIVTVTPNPNQVHCVASEPSYTVLRVSVWERGQEVAFETCVLGALWRGYRCLEMRSRLGTKIELCSLLVHVDFASDRVGMSMLGIGGEHVPPPPPPPLPPPEVEAHQN